jgi:hypothetical protein
VRRLVITRDAFRLVETPVMNDSHFRDDSFSFDPDFTDLGPLVPALATLVAVVLLLVAVWKF